MKDIREVCPQEEEGFFRTWSISYSDLIQSIGDFQIVIQVDDDDYQGDSYLLLYDQAKSLYGILVFGWGSCSGCDALQACDSYEELEALRQHLAESITWRSVDETRDYITTRDWQGDFIWYLAEGQQFVREITNYMNALEVKPKTFYLHRMKDMTEVSGTGVVATGVEFANGKVVVSWRQPHPTVTVFNALQEVRDIHCHHDQTELIWF